MEYGGWEVVAGAMQRRQHDEEEEGKADVGKRVRKQQQERLRKEKQKRKPGRVNRGVGMWGSWSRVRCIPQPSAVCSSIRTQIAHPIVQVWAIELWLCCFCVCVCLCLFVWEE